MFCQFSFQIDLIKKYVYNKTFTEIADGNGKMTKSEPI